MEKKSYLISFCHLRRLVFHQSSPVHPVSGYSGGGWSERDEQTEDGGQTEILVSNTGFIKTRRGRPC